MSRRRLIVVRHPQTAWNAAGRWLSSTDIPLSEAGHEEAEELVRDARGLVVDYVWSSPLQRSRGTARLLADAMGQPPLRLDERLREIDAGIFEGLTEPELAEARIDLMFRRWRQGEMMPADVKAEAYPLASRRAAELLSEWKLAAGSILAVTHGGIARLMIAAHVLGLEPAAYRRLRLDTARAAIIELDDSQPRLSALNVRLSAVAACE